MRGKYHLIFTFFFFIDLWLVFGIYIQKHYFTITLTLTGVIFSFFPDIDTNFKRLGHRNIFTHSVLFPEIVYLFSQNFLSLLFVLAVGFHCLCDMRIRKTKMRGYYTIKFIGVIRLTRLHYKGMNGTKSTVWLFLNFLIAFIQFLVIILIF